MRPKLVVGVLLLAVGLAGVVALMSKAFRPRSSTASTRIDRVVPVESPSNAPQDRPAAQPSFSLAATAASKTANTPTPGDLAHARSVRQRIDELDALSMNDDAASRDAILAEMQNPDKAIRKAALEAAIQFGDRSVIPPLQDFAAQTDDPAEKADILAAIDYINLPSLTEYLAQQKTPGAAMESTNAPPGPAGRFGSGRHSRRPPPQGSPAGN